MNESKSASMEFALNWQSPYAKHTDCYFLKNINFWRDIFPGHLENKLPLLSEDQTERETFEAGELVPAYSQKNVYKIKESQMNRHFRGPIAIETCQGRYYPRTMIAGVGGTFKEDMRPFRYLGKEDNRFVVDFNHPLANYPLTLEATLVKNLPRSSEEHGGKCHDIAEILTDNGVGLQARLPDRDTDFLYGRPFGRRDEEDDQTFYAKPRFVNHIDTTAMQRISNLYARFIKPGMKVLDLMSSWISHLPEDIENVTGLGLNSEELAKNEKLADFIVQDLNRRPVMPFKDQEFDVVICSLSVEYMTAPIDIFREVARILKPGGYFILTFSERWFPTKVVNIWSDIHPFERMGLVIEYFRKSGQYENIHTESVRGFPRPADDKYYDTQLLSDPVYAVWATTYH